MHGHFPFFGILQIIFAVGILFFLYNISKSLGQIADCLKKAEKIPAAKPLNTQEDNEPTGT